MKESGGGVKSSRREGAETRRRIAIGERRWKRNGLQIEKMERTVCERQLAVIPI